ncbi:DMT family transporter [Azohydromonas sediminis]|uniref:DMT family transporter n=1 Tax=Azohydromonas sediminis TaxID=2259674 RepID=UPI000E65B532|nr:DMT family transporter [Azohydromonas sediminis]
MSVATLRAGAPTATRPLLGVALIGAMAACFAVLDTTVKVVGAVVPVLVVLWARYAFQAVVMSAWLAAPSRRALWRPAHPRFQLLRGTLLFTVSALSFIGLQHLPVAEFTAIFMITPVLSIVVAALVLRERLTPWRWALVAGAFAGALVVLRPGSGLFGWAALFPLAGATCYAAFQVLTRRLAGHEHPLTTHLYTGVVGTVLGSLVLAALPVDVVPSLAAADARAIALMLLVGLMGTVGHGLLILAMGMAPVALLMPFTYLQIVLAAFAGWVAFGHLPDGWAVVGMAVIAACGATSAWLNVRAAPGRRAPPPVAVDSIGD